jgi:hypothetical protein
LCRSEKRRGDNRRNFSPALSQIAGCADYADHITSFFDGIKGLTRLRRREMRISKVLKLTFILVFPAFSFALPIISGLYDTGVDDQGTPLSINDMDHHYVLTGPLSSAYLTPQVPPNLDKTWWPMDNSGLWIGPKLDGIQAAPGGDYVYTLTFDLTGFNPSIIVISGQWSSDNSSYISLNGVQTPFQTPSSPDDPFAHIYNFTLDSGFVAAENTIEFHVHNITGPTGLLVQNLVPEPATLLLVGLGGIFLRRSKQRTAYRV